jgi:nucleoside-diphosphate-sugar epimerase
MPDNSTVLATGKSGTIGRALSDQVGRLSYKLEEDIPVNIATALENKTIIHLAGVVGPKIVEDNERYAYEVNVNGTIRLAESALSHNTAKFIYVSTSHVYGNSPLPITEEQPVNPNNLYSEQKAIAENKLQMLFESYPNKLIILRVFSVLDWGCKPFTLGGLVERIKVGGKHSIANSEDVRDFLAPRQIAFGLERFAQTQVAGGIYNLCSGEGRSIRDAIVMMLSDDEKALSNLSYDNMNSSVPTIIGNDAKIREVLGERLKWKPSEYSK